MYYEKIDQLILIIHINLYILGCFGGKSFYFRRKREEIGYSQYIFDLLGRVFDKFVGRRLLKLKGPDSSERKKNRKVATINFEKENVFKLWSGKFLLKDFCEEI